MYQATGEAIAFVVAGTVAALIVAIQFKRGVTFGNSPPVKFERKTDPFGFWLGITIPSLVAIFLLGVGLVGFFHRVFP